MYDRKEDEEKLELYLEVKSHVKIKDYVKILFN